MTAEELPEDADVVGQHRARGWLGKKVLRGAPDHGVTGVEGLKDSANKPQAEAGLEVGGAEPTVTQGGIQEGLGVAPGGSEGI